MQFLKILFILFLLCPAFPAYSMEQDASNRSLTGQLWHAAKEHPVFTGTILATTAFGLWAYRVHSASRLPANKDIAAKLLQAVNDQNADAVKQFLDAGADVNARDRLNVTLLQRAAMYGHIKIVKILLRAGADTKAKDAGWMALDYAAHNGHAEVAKALLDADSDIGDVHRGCLLHRAAEHNRIEVIRMLLNSGTDIEAKDDDGNTALHQATKHGHAESVSILLERGADIEAKDKDGKTALGGLIGDLRVCEFTLTTFLYRKSRYEVIKVLLEKGADSADLEKMDDFFCANPFELKEFVELATPISCHNAVIMKFLHKEINNNQHEKVQFLLHQNYEFTKETEASRARINVASCSFNRLQPKLSADVRKKILSFLPEDVVSANHAKVLLNIGANLKDFVAVCPVKWFVHMYLQVEACEKIAFLEKVVSAIVENRLQNIRRWLRDKKIQNINLAQINPAIITMLDSDNVEQHRAAIEQHVREAFLATSANK